MLRLNYINAAGLVATGASTLGAVYCLANDSLGWTGVFAAYGAGSVFCWLKAQKWAREMDQAVEAIAPVAGVDKVVARLDQQIAEARRNHKPRRHLIAAKHARIHQLLRGIAR